VVAVDGSSRRGWLAVSLCPTLITSAVRCLTARWARAGVASSALLIAAPFGDTTGAMSGSDRVSKGRTRGVRVDDALDERLVKIAQRMSTPWHKANVSEAIRAALLEGMTVLEAKLPPLEREQALPSARRASAPRKKQKP